MLNYHYTRLELTLSSLALLALLEKQDLSLETLADDLTQVFKEKQTSRLKEAALLMDYLQMLQTTDIEVSEEEIADDLVLLLRLIALKIERYRSQKKMLPRAIHLELPNVLVLEYAPSAAPKPVHYLIRKQERKRNE